MNNLLKKLWILLGGTCLALGTLGILLPILPTVPFYLATVFCFAKGSERLHGWFTKSTLYHRYLESYVKEKSMTLGTKASIMTTVTIIMGLGFFFMDKVPIARVIIGLIWIGHLLYFIFCIKTIKLFSALKQ